MSGIRFKKQTIIFVESTAWTMQDIILIGCSHEIK